MTLGWGCSAGVRQESEGGDGEGDKGDTCGGPSQVLFSPSPQNLGSENVAGGREGRERAGQRISSLVSGKGQQEPAGGWRPPMHRGCFTCSVSWRRPQGASGESSPQRGSGGLWLLRGEPGGPRHGLEWGTPDSTFRVPRSPRPLALTLSSVAHLVRDSRKETFSGFFPLPP